MTSRCDSKKNPLTPIEAVCLQIKCILLKKDVPDDIEKAVLKSKVFGPSFMRSLLNLLRQEKCEYDDAGLKKISLISFHQGAWRVEGNGKFANVVSTTFDL